MYQVRVVRNCKGGVKYGERYTTSTSGMKCGRCILVMSLNSAVFRAPQHRSCGGGEAQTLEGAAREWEKFRLELKRAIPGYATDVFVMLELKTISFYSVSFSFSY